MFAHFITDAKLSVEKYLYNTVIMGPLTLHSFSFHSSDNKNTKHQLFAINISNRLILITFFAFVAFTFPICGIVALETLDQQQSSDDSQQATPCEAKTLDDVPPDPVSILNMWNKLCRCHVKIARRKHNIIGLERKLNFAVETMFFAN